MKIEWHASDIVPGRRVSKPGAKEQSIIGFDPCKTGREASRYAVISLEDGMLTRVDQTLQQIADFLNEIECVPLELINENTGNLHHSRPNGPIA
jgi:hypothetical protein